MTTSDLMMAVIALVYIISVPPKEVLNGYDRPSAAKLNTENIKIFPKVSKMGPSIGFLPLILFSHLALSIPLHPRQTSTSSLTPLTTSSWPQPLLAGNHQPPLFPNNQKQSINQGLASVTNPSAFNSGAGNRNNNFTSENPSVPAINAYNCYSGSAENFPTRDNWISFDAMWNSNLAALGRGCAVFGTGPENTPDQVADIYAAVQSVASSSLVDHRFILAIIMQEVYHDLAQFPLMLNFAYS